MITYPTNHREIVYGEVLKFLNKFKDLKDKTVLEIGAGNTTEFKLLFEQFGMKYSSLDKIDGSFMENIQEKDNTFDLVFSCHAFEHTTHPLQALMEFKRVLKDGGMTFLITPFYCEHHVTGADEDHFFVLTDLQMRRLYRAVGLKEQSIYVQTCINQFMNISKRQDYNLISIGVKDSSFTGVLKK
jgi:SAM-dependent methyltransferase